MAEVEDKPEEALTSFSVSQGPLGGRRRTSAMPTYTEPRTKSAMDMISFTGSAAYACRRYRRRKALKLNLTLCPSELVERSRSLRPLTLDEPARMSPPLSPLLTTF